MRTAEISFIEQSKAVTTKVKLVGDGEIDVEGNNKAMEEAKRLYNEASSFSATHTIRKQRS